MTNGAILAKTWSSLTRPIPATLPVSLKDWYPYSGGSSQRRVACSVSAHATKEETTVERRSGNYSPRVWDYDLLLSFTSDYQGDMHVKQVERLKYDVNILFNGENNPLVKLELIDTIQRLGLEYLFEEEIRTALDSLYRNADASWINEDLYTTALKFRLFRQNGFLVSEDVFNKFKDKNGELMEIFQEDVKTLLTLYDASFLAYEYEATIDEARNYTTKKLNDLIQRSVLPEIWAKKVAHALDVPLHWRLNRLEARWFMDTYEQELDMNQSLLDLSKLEYNRLQSIHLQEAKELIGWWLDMGLDEMPFSRDRVLEHYLWCCSMLHEPRYGRNRIGLTKITCLITLIDDVYDIYGSLEELELYTDFTNRWDMSRIDELPPPMRTTILAMFNTSNEIGYMSIKEQGFNTVPYISKAWADLCKTYLKEAKWYNEGSIPTFEQYMSNSVVSITSPLMLIVTYILTSEKLTKEALEFIQDLPPIVHCAGAHVRLTNDLATSKDELARGDNVKSIQFYMNEAGVTEEVAREYIKDLIEKTWKIMNKSLTAEYPFSEPAFLRASQNLSRAAQYFYKGVDGHGVNPDIGTKDRLKSLLLKPVPIDQLALDQES